MNLVFAIGAGGALGAALRYMMSVAIMRVVGGDMPWGTLTVNVLGCFIMGLLAEAFALRYQLGPEMRAFLTTGILGGFTTFSAFSLDVALLIERGNWGGAAAYAAGSVLLSVGGLFAGLWLVRVLA